MDTEIQMEPGHTLRWCFGPANESFNWISRWVRATTRIIISTVADAVPTSLLVAERIHIEELGGCEGVVKILVTLLFRVIFLQLVWTRLVFNIYEIYIWSLKIFSKEKKYSIVRSWNNHDWGKSKRNYANSTDFESYLSLAMKWWVNIVINSRLSRIFNTTFSREIIIIPWNIRDRC